MRLRVLLPVLFLLAFCVRAGTLDLPVEGQAAVLAAGGARWAEGGGLETAGRGPLLPMLTGAAVELGVPATLALRWLDVLAACLLPGLLLLLAQRLGIARRRALLGACLLALHPLGVLGSGGIVPDTAATTGALALGALVLLSCARAALRRAALLPLALLGLSDGGGLIVLIPLVVAYVRREPGPRLQTAVALLAGGLLLAGFATWFRAQPGPDLGAALLWLVLAPLGIFLPGVPRGLHRIATSATGTTWIAAVGLGGLGLLLGAPFPTGLALPLLLLAGLEGSAHLGLRIGRPVAWGTASACAVATLVLVSGGLQVALAPGDPLPSGRLHLLRQAVRAAAHVAGERGWIVLGIAEGRPEDQASLADLNPDHWTWSRRAAEADTAAVRRLRVFPAAAFEPGQEVAIVTRAGTSGAIETFDGAGIYHQEVVERIGPYVVLRARRP